MSAIINNFGRMQGAVPRQFEAIEALLAVNSLQDDAIRTKQDAHSDLEARHREAERALDAKCDALRTELRNNSAARRALQAELAARIALNEREPVYRGNQ